MLGMRFDREMLSRGKRSLVFYAAISLFAWGCGEKEEIELRVGERELTATEIDEYLADYVARMPVGRKAPKREDFVPKLAQRLQLAMAAERQGLTADPELPARRDSEHKYAVLRLYAPMVIDTTTTLTMAEVREKHEREKEERFVRQIVVNNEEEANEVLHLLEGGADFEATALEHSVATRVASTLGDLGWTRRRRMVPAVDEVIFSLSAGNDYGIAKSEHGVHVLNVTEIRYPQPANPDSFYAALFEDEHDYQLMEREGDYMMEIQEGAEIVYNDEICQQIADLTSTSWDAADDVIQHFLPDTQRVLLTFDGTELSVGQAFKEYRSYSPGRKALLKSPEVVRSFFRGMALENELYQTALELGLGEHPEVEKGVQRGVEIWLAKKAKALLSAPSTDYTPTDQEIRADYDENPERFTRPDRIVIGEIMTAKEFRIDQADSLLKGGVPFREVAKHYSEGLTSRSGGRLGPFQREYRPNRWDQVDTLEIGERTPPFQDGDRWAIVELRKRVPSGKRTFEEARQSIQHRLTQEFQQAHEEEVRRKLDEWFPVVGLSQ